MCVEKPDPKVIKLVGGPFDGTNEGKGFNGSGSYLEIYQENVPSMVRTRRASCP